MTPCLNWLIDHPQHSDTFAAWIHHQFHYEYAGQALTDWQREFADGQTSGDWKCLIALEGNQLQGGAALARADLPRRPDLGPWLACVFITPVARGKGLAERLIEGVCAQAKACGETRIYLHTQDQHDYYAKRGWTVRERFCAWDQDQWLMVRDL